MDASAKMHRSRFGNLKKPRISVSGVAKFAGKLWGCSLATRTSVTQTVNPSICRHRVAFHVLFASFCRQASLILGVGNRVIRYIFQQLANFFVPLIDKLNGSLVLGGIGEDVRGAGKVDAHSGTASLWAPPKHVLFTDTRVRNPTLSAANADGAVQ